MFFTLIFGLLVIYLLAGVLSLLVLDLEKRHVCRRTWSSLWLFALSVCVWPLFLIWVEAKWRLKNGW